MTLPKLSFEFFPPKSAKAKGQMQDAMDVLAGFAPEFISVTCGTGGGSAEQTQDTVTGLTKAHGVTGAAHITTTIGTKDEIAGHLDALEAAGITKVVALRGDYTADAQPVNGGYTSSVALVEAIAKRGGFDIYVGAYPESHPDAASAKQNIDFLKAKLDAGAKAAITQYFFEAETYLSFRDECTAQGITAPLIPGILPVHDWNAVQRFSAKCGASIAERVKQAYDRAIRDDRVELLSLSQGSTLVDRLITEGVDGLHFYTLNRAELTTQICEAVGYSRADALSKVA